jgi:hypothetical protein
MKINISNFEINSLKDTILNINEHNEIVNNSNNYIYILNIKKKLGFFTSVNYIILMTNDDNIIKNTANCKEISYKIDLNLETYKSKAYIYPYINEYLINNIKLNIFVYFINRMPKIFHNNSGGNLKNIKTKLKKVFQDNLCKRHYGLLNKIKNNENSIILEK